MKDMNMKGASMPMESNYVQGSTDKELSLLEMLNMCHGVLDECDSLFSSLFDSPEEASPSTGFYSARAAVSTLSERLNYVREKIQSVRRQVGVL